MGNNENENTGERIREIPEDIEWPRYEDGRLVDIGHILDKGMAVGVEMRSEGYCITCLNGSIQKPYGERIKRPALAADGEIVREGETVWNAATGEEYKVVDARDGYAYLSTYGGVHVNLKLLSGAVTHHRPMLDADGVPIHEGDTLYAVKTGRSCKVLKVASNSLDGRVRVEFDAPELEAGYRTLVVPTSLLTYQCPVFDARGDIIRPGDVVYANAAAGGDGTAWRVVRLDPKRAHSVHAERENGRAIRRDLVPAWLTHEPDTWERIEADAANLDEMPCDFNARDLVRRCKRIAGSGGAATAPAMPDGVEWPRWDDGEFVTVVPPFKYCGREACKLCYDGGVWFLLDPDGDVFHSIHKGETLERSKWGACR